MLNGENLMMILDKQESIYYEIELTIISKYNSKPDFYLAYNQNHVNE